MRVCQTCSRRYPDNATHCLEDGQPLVDLGASGSPAEPTMIGARMFGDYVLERKLGDGGMGSVYLAKNTSIDQAIAVKVLHAGSSQSSEMIQRFNREARVIAKLTHPNIIRVFIFGRTHDDMIYLAMEYVDGQSLRQLVESHGRLSEPHAIYILRQVLGALAEAHDFGVVHRDLKPDNILLTEYRGNKEFVKVLDFGIAKVAEPDGATQQQLTQAGIVYGTPDYLSPEQAMAKPIDPRSDLYSIGIILWEMLTGRVPYTAESAMSVLVQHAFDPPPDPEQAPVPMSTKMKAILKTVLAKDPEERFPSAQAFLDALNECENELHLSGAYEQAVDVPEQKTELWQPTPGFTEYARAAIAQYGAASEASNQHQGQAQVPTDPAYAAQPHGQGFPQQYGHGHYTQITPAPTGTTGRRVVVAMIVIGLLVLATMAVVIVFLLR